MATPDALSPKLRDEEDAAQLLGAHALFFTQYYRPELIGSAPFCSDLAEWLGTRGCRMTVIAGPPHYPDPASFRAARESLPPSEFASGVLVERLKSHIPRSRSAWQRILAELSFVAHGIGALFARRVGRAPLVLSLCPSILTVALASLARARQGRHVVIVHDIQSGLARGLGLVRSSMLLRVMRFMERTLLNRADMVVVLNEAMKEELRRLGVTTPIEIAPVWVDVDAVAPAIERKGRAPRVLYSGNLGRKQGLDQIIELARMFQSERPDIEIVFRGEGSERASLQARVSELDLANVHFDALWPPERLTEGLCDGDVHLVPQEPAAAEFAVPSKIYSIMAAGRPFVATANPGSPLWRLRRESRAFLTVRANDHVRLARMVARLVDDTSLRRVLGERGRRYATENCAREKVLGDLENLFWSDERLPVSSLLVVEPEAAGHQLEWLRHLVRQIPDERQGAVVWFAVAPELFDELTAEARKIGGDRVRVISLSELDAKLCRSSWLTVSGFARWWIARRYGMRTQAESIHVLSLDHLSLPLALGLGTAGRPLTGTLFRPSVHYRLLGDYRPSLREQFRDFRKDVLYRLMLLNPSLRAVHSLDPFFPGFARSYYLNGDKVRPLVDPAHPATAVAQSERSLADRIPRDRTVFLLFGYLSERKGVLALLDALRELPSESHGQIAVMLAGRIDPSIEEQVRRRVSRLRLACSQLWLEYEDRRITEGELEALVQRADVLLAPYQRFVGSSGVLMWAARARKPLLAQDFGVLGAIVRELGLGKVVDTTNARSIADAMTEMAEQGWQLRFNRRAAMEFSALHTPRAFAEAILESL